MSLIYWYDDIDNDDAKDYNDDENYNDENYDEDYDDDDNDKYYIDNHNYDGNSDHNVSDNANYDDCDHYTKLLLYLHAPLVSPYLLSIPVFQPVP